MGFLERHAPRRALHYQAGSDARTLRDALGCFATGVTVVTTLDEQGQPVGLTANSFSSVSLDPPLILFCLARSSSNLERFRRAEHFAINVLHIGQQPMSGVFARSSTERFDGVAWESWDTGAPILSGSLASFECATIRWWRRGIIWSSSAGSRAPGSSRAAIPCSISGAVTRAAPFRLSRARPGSHPGSQRAVGSLSQAPNQEEARHVPRSRPRSRRHRLLRQNPDGRFQGVLSDAKSTDLGAAAVKAALERAGLAPDKVEQIIMGCVLPAGLGQAPARQAGLGAGLPISAEATTINKMCGSGMQAAMMAHDALLAGSAEVIVAGGMESMTNAPYLMHKHRLGARIGHDVISDSMYLDGLEDAYEPGKLMGQFAEDTAKAYQFTREQQDAYAVESAGRAKRAQDNGDFDAEITPVEVKTRKGVVVVDRDEQPTKSDPSKIPNLKPAFGKDGTITAASAASISDGAAALVMMRQSTAQALGLTPIARVVAQAAHAHEPSLFTTAPVFALQKALKKAGWTPEDVDLWEVNEAFAIVPMIAMQELGVPHDKINVNGGACALGHPLGASGARVLTTLLSALKARGKTRGMAALCIGGGEATAMGVELV